MNIAAFVVPARRIALARPCVVRESRSLRVHGQKLLQLFLGDGKMPSYDTVSGVMEFLGSYRKAFEDYDTDAILDHYVFPCTIISDAEKITPSLLQTKEELRAGVDYVLSLHRQIGYRSGQLLLLDITELSPRLTGMMIRSRMRDKNGRPLYEFQGFYSLARLEAGCRIVAISHNQIPRLLACAGRPSIPIS
jgi:hypothetical protein